MSISTTLQRLLEERGENAHSLAIKSGVPQPTVFRILNGVSADPRRSNIQKIARALSVSIDVFYGAAQGQKISAYEPGDTTGYLRGIDFDRQAKTNTEERVLRALRLGSTDQREMILHLADKILEHHENFDERAAKS